MEKLKRYDLNCNIFDVYDYDGLSMQELLCQFYTKINECVDFSNSTLDLCEWLVNEGLKQEVALKLTNWLNDGTLENIINVTLFENLNKKIDNVSLQLEQNENYLNEFKNEYNTEKYYITPTYFKTESNTYDEAFNLCFEYAKTYNKKVVVPAGEYILTKPLLIDFSIDLEGCGDLTRLKFTGLEQDSNAITFHNKEGLGFIKFGNLKIIGEPNFNAIALNEPTENGINSALVDCNFHDMIIYNFKNGINAYYIWCNTFDNIRIQSSIKPLTLNNQVNNILFNRCSFVSYSEACNFTNCEGIQFNSCEFANASADVINIYQSNIIFNNSYLENVNDGYILIGNESETIPSLVHFNGGIISGKFKIMNHKTSIKINNARFTLDKFKINQVNDKPNKALLMENFEIQGVGLPKPKIIRKFIHGDDTFDFLHTWGGGRFEHTDKNGYTLLNSSTGMDLTTTTEVGKQYTIELEICSDTIKNIGILHGISLPLGIDIDTYFKTFKIPFIASDTSTKLTFDGELKIKKVMVYEGLK